MTPRFRPIDRDEYGGGMAEYFLILAPLAAFVALFVLTIVLSGSS